MTKLLRVLTGVHAGAELRLSAGMHRIGADDDADIRLSDWTGHSVLLSVDELGLVGARRVGRETYGATSGAGVGSDAAPPSSWDDGDTGFVAQQAAVAPAARSGGTQPDDEPGTVILIDFVPMQFGDTVVCIGSADVAWPSDLDLLSTLLVKPDATRRAEQRSRRRRLTGIACACAMLGAVIVIGSVMLTTDVSRAALPHDAGDLAGRVNVALGVAHLRELHAQARGSTVTVTGMVATPDEDGAARKLLMRLSSMAIVRRYDIAQDDARDIEDSLGVHGIHVAYVGRGTFDVTGKAANPADIDTALTRLRRDLSPNVRSVQMQVTQAEDSMPVPPSFSEMMASDDVRYAQTPDGIKHIYAPPDTPPASGAATVSAASAATAPGAPGGVATPPSGSTSAATDALTPAAADVPPVVASGAARGVMQPVDVNTEASAWLPLPK